CFLAILFLPVRRSRKKVRPRTRCDKSRREVFHGPHNRLPKRTRRGQRFYRRLELNQPDCIIWAVIWAGSRTIKISLIIQHYAVSSGGGGGIRTHDTLARMPVFKTGLFNHSSTPPQTCVKTRRLVPNTGQRDNKRRALGQDAPGEPGIPVNGAPHPCD